MAQVAQRIEAPAAPATTVQEARSTEDQVALLTPGLVAHDMTDRAALPIEDPAAPPTMDLAAPATLVQEDLATPVQAELGPDAQQYADRTTLYYRREWGPYSLTRIGRRAQHETFYPR